MPRTEDIERFTQVLNSLGNEPAIRAARSETIDTVPPPEEEEQLDSLGAEAGGEEPVSPGESEGLQDIFQSLSALPDEEAAGPPSAEEPETAEVPLAQESAGEQAAGGAADEGLDFSSLFGEETAPEGIEELEKPAPAPPAQDSLAGLPEEEAFSLPEGEIGSLEADLSQMETVPDEETQSEPGTEPEPPAPGAGGEEFNEPGAFALESPEGAGAEAFSLDALQTGEAPGSEVSSGEAAGGEVSGGEPGGGEPGGGESFELPDLGDLSFSEPAAGPAAPAVPAEPSFEEPLPEETIPTPEEPLPSFEEPGIDQASIQGFDLDTATLPEPETGTAVDQFPSEMPGELPGPAEGPSQAPGAEMESLGEESLGELNLDQFSLPESAQEFGAVPVPTAAPKQRAPAPPKPRPAERGPAERRPAERGPARPRPRAAVASSEPAVEGELELTPEQFAHLKKSLESLPRNLKIVVQDLIGEGIASGADQAALINLLLRDAGAQEIAALAGRISGKRIRIPAGYEKRTGAAFEAEQRTFAYAFRENFLPMIRVVAITVLAGGLFGFLGYNYVYRPLLAFANYRSGYTQIFNDRYTLANERFARATSIWPMKGWYYSYADAFAAKRQYVLAEKKYDDLLATYPGDKRGILDYARMESTRLAGYEKADALLRQYLDVHRDDYDALLASGDNSLLWADRDRTKFGAARLAYAVLIEKYGARDELLFRMLRYFIRTDNGPEVERLRAFYATRPEAKIDAPVFAELGGYLVDHRRLDWVQEVLFRADKAEPGLYEVHYNLARYYRIVQNSPDEKKALDATVQLLERSRRTDPLTFRRLNVEIDTHTRLGEYHYKAQEYIPAERELLAAIRLVETNQKNKLIDRDRLYGRPYAVLGDLYYYIQGDLQTAAVQFQNAISNLYTDPLLTYKIGYVQYRQADYKAALASFSSAEDAAAYPSGNEVLAPASAENSGPAAAAENTRPVPPPPPGQPPQNLLYALGNTFYQRGAYFAAQGSFLRLLDRLETRRAAQGFLHPEDRPEDRALLETLVRVNNNLGVTMFRLAERTGDRIKKSEALVYLASATEIAASLARSPDTVKRSEDRSQPSLNMRGILYPVTGYVLQIYSALPKDFDAAAW